MSKQKPAIFHNAFFNALLSAQIDGKPLPATLVTDLAAFTSGGVAPKGAHESVLKWLDTVGVEGKMGGGFPSYERNPDTDVGGQLHRETTMKPQTQEFLLRISVAIEPVHES